MNGNGGRKKTQHMDTKSVLISDDEEDYPTIHYAINPYEWDNGKDLCEVEKTLFRNAFKHFNDLDKDDVNNNVILVDIFVRNRDGSIKFEDNNNKAITHTVVLWRKRTTEVLLIDPNLPSRVTDYLRSRIDSVNIEKYYIVSNIELGRKDNLIYKPKDRYNVGKAFFQYGDCVDIASKISKTIKTLQNEAVHVVKRIYEECDTGMSKEEIEGYMPDLIEMQMLGQVSNQSRVILGRIKGADRWNVPGKWNINCGNKWGIEEGKGFDNRQAIGKTLKKFDKSKYGLDRRSTNNGRAYSAMEKFIYFTEYFEDNTKEKYKLENTVRRLQEEHNIIDYEATYDKEIDTQDIDSLLESAYQEKYNRKNEEVYDKDEEVYDKELYKELEDYREDYPEELKESYYKKKNSQVDFDRMKKKLKGDVSMESKSSESYRPPLRRFYKKSSELKGRNK